MSSSGEKQSSVRLARGDLLTSRAQTLVNTVNTVGVMGKGIALAFKRRYPDMYRDYVKRCNAGQVRLGEPYLYKAPDHLVVNFPTKDHWRSVSKLEDIERGLAYLHRHLAEWGITSLAVPPLGCGNGQLEWSVVGPTLYRHLRTFGIQVELYVPHEIEPSPEQLSLLDSATRPDREIKAEPRLDAAMVALVEILCRVEREPLHWPVGRVMFQKLAYFATAAGLPTGLEYEANSYGPFASELNRLVGRLQNNGLVQEHRRGQMIETRVGKTFKDARKAYAADLNRWNEKIDRVADIMVRFDTHRAEIAGSVHYVVTVLTDRFGRAPTATEVIEAVEKWKVRRQSSLSRPEIARAIVELATQKWIEVTPDAAVDEAVEALTIS